MISLQDIIMTYIEIERLKESVDVRLPGSFKTLLLNEANSFYTTLGLLEEDNKTSDSADTKPVTGLICASNGLAKLATGWFLQNAQNNGLLTPREMELTLNNNWISRYVYMIQS